MKPRLRTSLAIGTMVAVALVAPVALPCGAPFGNGINVDPRQDIVMVHKDGIETYVFQPRFCGSATEFGLILPVPAKLSAQPALSKEIIFPKLVELSQPLTVYSTACINRGTRADASIGGMPDGGSGTTVVSSGTVGFMDYAQLDTASLDALTAWLTSNGYPYDAQATAAFDYYVQKGWYFLTFKVSQGTFAGSTTCKDLGPVKISFPTSIPVVPTRMATARAKDTSGTLSYAPNFSWRVFGISEGSQQIGFAKGAASTRTLGFSGLLDTAWAGSLDGLAAAGDRVTKLTVTFNYGATDPDVEFALAVGQDYRETINQVTYVQCTDGGMDALAIPPQDAASDTSPYRDSAADGISALDGGAVATPDTGTQDLLVIELDATGLDATQAVDTSDAGVAKTDTGTAEQPIKKQGGGWCSVQGSSQLGARPISGTEEALPALVLASLAMGFVRRRGRSPRGRSPRDR